MAHMENLFSGVGFDSPQRTPRTPETPRNTGPAFQFHQGGNPAGAPNDFHDDNTIDVSIYMVKNYQHQCRELHAEVNIILFSGSSQPKIRIDPTNHKRLIITDQFHRLNDPIHLAGQRGRTDPIFLNKVELELRQKRSSKDVPTHVRYAYLPCKARKVLVPSINCAPVDGDPIFNNGYTYNVSVLLDFDDAHEDQEVESVVEEVFMSGGGNRRRNTQAERRRQMQRNYYEPPPTRDDRTSRGRRRSSPPRSSRRGRTSNHGSIRTSRTRQHHEEYEEEVSDDSDVDMSPVKPAPPPRRPTSSTRQSSRSSARHEQPFFDDRHSEGLGVARRVRVVDESEDSGNQVEDMYNEFERRPRSALRTKSHKKSAGTKRKEHPTLVARLKTEEEPELVFMDAHSDMSTPSPNKKPSYY